MIYKARLLIVTALGLLILSSCFVGSSLIFFESDTVGKTNLVRNHGFNTNELAEQSLPQGWTLMNASTRVPESIAVDYTESIEGDNSLRIDASPNAVMIVSEAFPVRRYGGYYVRVKLRSDHLLNQKVQLHFITFNPNGKTLNRFKSKLRPQTEWKNLLLSAGFIREGARFGRVAILIPPFAQGSIWIDDAGAWEVHSFNID